MHPIKCTNMWINDVYLKPFHFHVDKFCIVLVWDVQNSRNKIEYELGKRHSFWSQTTSTLPFFIFASSHGLIHPLYVSAFYLFPASNLHFYHSFFNFLFFGIAKDLPNFTKSQWIGSVVRLLNLPSTDLPPVLHITFQYPRYHLSHKKVMYIEMFVYF